MGVSSTIIDNEGLVSTVSDPTLLVVEDRLVKITRE